MQTNNLIGKVELESALYVVATPIGNFEDITIRALKTLASVDIILCEDTRTSGNLLKHFGIQNKLVSYHSHNETSKLDFVITQLNVNKSLALISDAGTPCISDPGAILVSELVKQNLKVIPIPGANAAISAYSASGILASDFKFYGFPPLKKGRQTFLKTSFDEKTATILYESSHRILKLLNELDILYSDKLYICIAKELTKIYEKFYFGSPAEVLAKIQQDKSDKGEFVLIGILSSK